MAAAPPRMRGHQGWPQKSWSHFAGRCSSIGTEGRARGMTGSGFLKEAENDQRERGKKDVVRPNPSPNTGHQYPPRPSCGFKVHEVWVFTLRRIITLGECRWEGEDHKHCSKKSWGSLWSVVFLGALLEKGVFSLVLSTGDCWIGMEGAFWRGDCWRYSEVVMSWRRGLRSPHWMMVDHWSGQEVRFRGRARSRHWMDWSGEGWPNWGPI